MTELYLKDCKNFDRCIKTIALEVLANVGERTLSGLNRCDQCNMYEKKENEQTNYT